MYKSILLLSALISLCLGSIAQTGIGIGLGSSSANIYDERLSPEIYSGQNIRWSIAYTSRKYRELDLTYWSATLSPSNKGFLSVKNQYSYQNAKIAYLNSYHILDSLNLPFRFNWGWLAELSGRYGKQDLASTILPYDQTLYSYQVALDLGMHLDVNYEFNTKQNIRLRFNALFLNTGFNNPYSPHDSWYLYNTVIIPNFYNFIVPLTYSYRINSKFTTQAQIETEFYRYRYQQENRAFNLSFSLALFVSL